MANSAPVGVFDSGIGGLSILREIRRRLPAEHLVYVADSAHAPYGDKPSAFVRERAEAIVDFLERSGAKAIVVACNTATGVAVEDLRARCALPIVAMEPAVKPAAARTRSGTVGVLATTRTLSSRKFADLVRLHGGRARVLAQPCPGLVEQVEAGDFASAATRQLVIGFVRPLIEQGADTLVLGCTHYSFLNQIIADIAGPAVEVIDPAPAVVTELTRRLVTHALTAPAAQVGTDAFWTSGSPEQVHPVIARLWPASAVVRRLPD